MNPRQELSRRRFLKRGAAATASAAAMPLVVSSQALAAPGRTGANDRVRIGVIGVGIRGKDLISNVPEGARVTAICDCSRARIASALEPKGPVAQRLEQFRRRDADRCATYQDYRRMLDQEKLDAVIIAASDHHHVQSAILACQAGLDVYVEKPLTVTIQEGRALVTAVRRHGRVLQVGTQQRSMEMNRFACEFIREGGLGKISLVELPNYPGPMRYEGLPREPIPEGLAWDLFCGPTPLRPHNRKLWVKDEFDVDGRRWRGWDMWRSYAGHLMTNWAAHSVDMVQWALGTDDTGPVETWPLNEEYQGEMRLCPVAMRYASGVELRMDFPLAVRDRWIFHGQHGTMSMHRNQFTTDPVDLVASEPDPSVVDIWTGPGIVAQPHLQNWLDCIKTRGEPTAPVEVGHRSVTICHLANIVRDLGRKLHWDPKNEVFVGDAEANNLLSRPRRRGFELPV